MIQKLEDPKKIAGNLSDPKNSGNFAKPRKIGFGQISNPKNRTSIRVKIVTCAPPPPGVNYLTLRVQLYANESNEGRARGRDANP